MKCTIEFVASGPWGVENTFASLMETGKREGLAHLRNKMRDAGIVVIGEPELLAFIVPEKGNT